MLVLLKTQKAHYKIFVGWPNHAFHAKRTFAFDRFLGKNVSFKGFLVRNFTRACYVEALLCAGVCFYFWHVIIIRLRLHPAGGFEQTKHLLNLTGNVLFF